MTINTRGIDVKDGKEILLVVKMVDPGKKYTSTRKM